MNSISMIGLDHSEISSCELPGKSLDKSLLGIHDVEDKRQRRFSFYMRTFYGKRNLKAGEAAKESVLE